MNQKIENQIKIKKRENHKKEKKEEYAPKAKRIYKRRFKRSIFFL